MVSFVCVLFLFLVLSLVVGRRVRLVGFLFCLFFILSFLNLFVFPSPLVCRMVCQTVQTNRFRRVYVVWLRE